MNISYIQSLANLIQLSKYANVCGDLSLNLKYTSGAGHCVEVNMAGAGPTDGGQFDGREHSNIIKVTLLCTAVRLQPGLWGQ